MNSISDISNSSKPDGKEFEQVSVANEVITSPFGHILNYPLSSQINPDKINSTLHEFAENLYRIGRNDALLKNKSKSIPQIINTQLNYINNYYLSILRSEISSLIQELEANLGIIERKKIDFHEEEIKYNKINEKRQLFPRNFSILLAVIYAVIAVFLFASAFPLFYLKDALIKEFSLFNYIFPTLFFLVGSFCAYLSLNNFFNTFMLNKMKIKKDDFNIDYLNQLEKVSELHKKINFRKETENWLLNNNEEVHLFCHSSYERGWETGLYHYDKSQILEDKVTLKLTINEIFDEYRVSSLEGLLKHIEKVTDDEFGHPNIIGFERGSVIVKLEMNRNAFLRFITFFDEKNIQEFGVSKIDFYSIPETSNPIRLLDTNSDDKMMKIRAYLKENISNDLSKGFSEIKRVLSASSNKFNEYLLCYSRFNNVNRKNNNGILNYSEVVEEENKILLSLITFVDNLTVEDIEKFT